MKQHEILSASEFKDKIRTGEIVIGKKGRLQTGNLLAEYKIFLEKEKKVAITKYETIRIGIKPLSINKAYTGKRYKTDIYKEYTKKVLSELPIIPMPTPPYQIYFKFGFSNEGSDWDNCIKTTQDIIAKKYCFNDKLIRRGIVDIDIVSKGDEYFEFLITKLQ